jgi:UDP-N-acetylmuramoylalanine--D-glutamate ligase
VSDRAPRSEQLFGRKVLVMGLGVNGGGVGVTRYLVRQGAIVTVTDRASPHLLAQSLRQLEGLPIQLVLGTHREEDFRACDLVVRNPAVLASSPYLAIARGRGIPIESEIGLFWKACPSRRIVAITGTKGKTTTTRLIGDILCQAGFNPLVAGNLGVSGLDHLDAIGPDSWVVLELSSFQLDSLAIERPRPFIAVLTSLYPDHLDVYGTFESYRNAKAQLFQFQEAIDVAVVNGTSVECRELAREVRSRVRFFGPDSFPADWPLSLLGEHNRANAGAALVVAEEVGIARETAREAIGRFTTVADRLELVAEHDGVRFYNDAASGIPEATLGAFQALSSPIVWIAGGRDRGLDYGKLEREVKRKVRAAVLLPGTARDRVIEALPGMSVVLASTLEEAVVRASELARSGDAVLFSPAAGLGVFTLQSSGIGQYRHQDEPGNRFRDAVTRLASAPAFPGP